MAKLRDGIDYSAAKLDTRTPSIKFTPAAGIAFNSEISLMIQKDGYNVNNGLPLVIVNSIAPGINLAEGDITISKNGEALLNGKHFTLEFFSNGQVSIKFSLTAGIKSDDYLTVTVTKTESGLSVNETVEIPNMIPKERKKPITQLEQYLPWVYTDVLETDELMYTEDFMFDELMEVFNQERNNQYVVKADINGIKLFEDILNITANPAIEDIEFRRARIIARFSMQPPYTFPFLREKLDQIIGVGKWDAQLDFDSYTLYIETREINQLWFGELQIIINKIKPANIVFANCLLLNNLLHVNESVGLYDIIYNYILGKWKLGEKPFAYIIDKGVIKMAETPSIQQQLLNDIAGFIKTDTVKVVVNNTYTVTSLIKKTDGNKSIIEYVIPVSSKLGSVTNVKYKNSNNETLTDATVYIPLIADDILLRHTFTTKEGV